MLLPSPARVMRAIDVYAYSVDNDQARMNQFDLKLGYLSSKWLQQFQKFDRHKCIPSRPLPDQYIQMRAALHGPLLHEHHDFFLANQHPRAQLALPQCVNKYNTSFSTFSRVCRSPQDVGVSCCAQCAAIKEKIKRGRRASMCGIETGSWIHNWATVSVDKYWNTHGTVCHCYDPAFYSWHTDKALLLLPVF